MAAAPGIISFTPTTGGAGTVITINGFNFTGATAVGIGGIAATSFTVISDTQITAVVGSVTGGNVTVTTPRGTATLGGFYNGPVVSTFSPASGPIGTAVTITGSNFSSTASGNIVYFGAVRAAVSAASATSLSVAVPAGTTYQPITVTTGGLTAYTGKPFAVTFPSNDAGITVNSFLDKSDFITGSNPRSVAIGDMDGDGKPDLAVLNTSSNTASIFKNTGSGGTVSFAAKVDYPTGNTPYNVAIGDIDGDGKPDLTVTNSGSGTISIFKNTSTGSAISFAAKLDYPTGSTPFGVVIGDVDGDGKPDIAVTNYNSNSISILKNTTTGGTISFAAKEDYATGSTPYGIAIGDVNGDDKADLAVANYSSYTVSVFRNTGSSGTVSFAAKLDYPTGNTPYSIAIGDIDSDGKSDLVVANSSSNTVSVLKNTGSSGTVSFAAKTDFPTGTTPYSVAINDLDGDGKPDLATANYSSNTISILGNITSSGTISFISKADFIVGVNPYGIAIGDIDGDGKPDITATNYASNTISVLRNQTDAPYINSFTPSTGPIGTIITITGKSFTGATAVSIGGMAATSFTVVSDTQITAVVAAVTGGSVTVTTPKGTGTLGGFYNGPDITSFSPASGPIGTTVTITGTNFSPTVTDNTVYFGAVKAIVSAATASSLTVTVPTSATYQPVSVTVGNLTAYAGKPFIVTFPSNGAGFTGNSFTEKTDFAAGSSPRNVAVSDFDGDGKSEMAVVNVNSNTVSIFRNTGTGGNTSFATKVDYTTGSSPYSVAVADVDRDGKLDLITANYNSNTVSVFRNSTTGGVMSFAAKVDFATGSCPYNVVIGDLDRDGKPDLIIANNCGNTISVLRNTGTSGIISFAAKPIMPQAAAHIVLLQAISMVTESLTSLLQMPDQAPSLYSGTPAQAVSFLLPQKQIMSPESARKALS